MGWVVNATPRPLYPCERPGAHWIWGCVARRAGLDRCGKTRPSTGIRPPDLPAPSETLYRLSYPGPFYWNKSDWTSALNFNIIIYNIIVDYFEECCFYWDVIRLRTHEEISSLLWKQVHYHVKRSGGGTFSWSNIIHIAARPFSV